LIPVLQLKGSPCLNIDYYDDDDDDDDDDDFSARSRWTIYSLTLTKVDEIKVHQGLLVQNDYVVQQQTEIPI